MFADIVLIRSLGTRLLDFYYGHGTKIPRVPEVRIKVSRGCMLHSYSRLQVNRVLGPRAFDFAW